ncbi:MAG: CoA transferase [Alphaproteobacteria bacterium]
MSDETGPGALSGLRVLELGSMLAGPFCGTMLADFGADVIKAEKPGVPDALRQWPPFKDGENLLWRSMARGKRTITLDISRPDGAAVARDLIAKSDIVIENFRPGTMERWGFDPDALSNAEGGAVWVRISGYGQTGPNTKGGGYATIAEAYSGLASFTGYEDRGPMVSAFPMADYLTGIFAAFGALAAIQERARSGRGQIVDAALYEPLLRIIESAVLRYDQTGDLKERIGSQMQEDVPRNVYATKDGGWIALSIGSDRLFAGLCDAIGRPDLKEDPRYRTMAGRAANREAVDAEVAKWFASQDTETALKVATDHRVIVGRVFDMADVFEDVHVIARDMIRKVADPMLGPVAMPGPVPRLSRTPGDINWTGRPSGADNDAVYSGLLGYDERQIDALSAAGVI